MRARNRRSVDKLLITGGALAVGVVTAIGAWVGSPEQIDRMWVSAAVNESGSAQVTEVIDYDFGSKTDRHGIFRLIPGLSTGDQIDVSSGGAPDDTTVSSELVDGEDGVRVRIGDPAVTVSGRHRYQIGYDLPGVVTGPGVDWDAVGTAWEVPIERAEVHVVAPYEFVDPACFAGGSGSTASCDVEQVEPGHLVAEVTGLDAGEGLSIEAPTGAALPAAPEAPAPPTGRPDDPGTGLFPPAAVAALAVLVGAVPATVAVRRAGRERVATGGAADAAFAGGNPPGPWPPAGEAPADAAGPGQAPPGAGAGGWAPPGGESPGGEVRIDQDELEAMATTEFAPPEGLSPEQGGIVLAETVRDEHKTAWLIQAAIDGVIDLEEKGKKKVELTRNAPGTPAQARILDKAFGGRTTLQLGQYRKGFAKAWALLGEDLDEWRRTSGLWDVRAGGRRAGALVLGVLGGLLGALLAGLGGVAANRWGWSWIALAAAGGLLAGVGLAAAVGSWELRVRTAAGSAAWLRVESFRRFLAGSEAYHAEEAAQRGVLREYTAWALAVGEIDRWSQAVGASSVIPQEAGLSYVYMAPILMASTHSSATAPSSSGGSGGFGGGSFGGSVGGGAGGGGGGSW